MQVVPVFTRTMGLCNDVGGSHEFKMNVLWHVLDAAGLLAKSLHWPRVYRMVGRCGKLLSQQRLDAQADQGSQQHEVQTS